MHFCETLLQVLTIRNVSRSVRVQHTPTAANLRAINGDCPICRSLCPNMASCRLRVCFVPNRYGYVARMIWIGDRKRLSRNKIRGLFGIESVDCGIVGLFSVGIDQTTGVRCRISIEAYAIHRSERVTTDPPCQARRIVSRSVIIQSTFLISLLTGEAVALAGKTAETRFAVGQMLLTVDLGTAIVNHEVAAA